MIKEKEIIITGHSRNIEYYTKLGYDPKVRKEFIVKVEDLMPGSSYKIHTICDICNGETSNAFKDYYIYTNGLKEKFFCKKCNINKLKNTCLIKYGVDNPMKVDIFKENLKKSVNHKYGVDHYSMTDEYKSKYVNTCLTRYGKENTFQVSDFKDKSKKTSNDKYGSDYFINLESVRKETKLKKENNTKNKYEDLLDSDFNIIGYESDTFLMKHEKCGNEFLIGSSLVRSRLIQNVCLCTICNKIGNKFSYIEDEICEFLENNNISHIRGDRSILDGKEIDIYIPEYKLALEINGVYWHNEVYKNKDYHINKTINCERLGINLIHIWEDDWNNKKEILKSIISNKLNIVNNKIYARNCDVRDVSSSESRKFLNDNHIQGFSSSQLKLGLYYKNELVSLMTFGFRYTNSKKEYELIRFCNKINTNIVGASSKLFKNFLKNNKNIENIISYSDISIFDGNMYRILGFSEVSISEPNYFWVVDGIRRHRFNYNKKKLISEGFDPNKTEVEIMHDRGYYRIWGCGQKRWTFKV
jgi:G:T-mismatch repair DNA endonuclease (very short patch repair protein)